MGRGQDDHSPDQRFVRGSLEHHRQVWRHGSGQRLRQRRLHQLRPHPFGDPGGGWVDIFHEHLQNFVNVHIGHRTKVWRDRRLTGGEVFSDEIEQQLRSSAVLVSVISPAYLRSEWCNRELVGFAKAAQDRGSLRVGNLQRVVKVLRLPVERSALPPLLDEVLGAQFYRVDPASGRARDLLLDPSTDANKVFLSRVDDA